MTKHLAALLAFSLAPLAARAQPVDGAQPTFGVQPTYAQPAPPAAGIASGTVQISGGSALGFDQATSTGTDSDKVERTSFAADVTGLYYVTPRLGVGPLLGYRYVTVESGGETLVTKLLILGPAVGLDLPLAERLSFFAVAMGGRAMGSAELSRGGLSASSDTSGWAASAAAGIRVPLVRAVSLDLGVGYHWVELESDSDASGRTYRSTNKGFGLSIGFSVYLPTR